MLGFRISPLIPVEFADALKNYCRVRVAGTECLLLNRKGALVDSFRPGKCFAVLVDPCAPKESENQFRLTILAQNGKSPLHQRLCFINPLLPDVDSAKVYKQAREFRVLRPRALLHYLSGLVVSELRHPRTGPCANKAARCC